MPTPATDSHLRSLLKGLSWRFTATFTTMLIALLVTGDASIALTIGGIEAAGKIFIYYLHERLWLRIPWGRPSAPGAVEPSEPTPPATTAGLPAPAPAS